MDLKNMTLFFYKIIKILVLGLGIKSLWYGKATNITDFPKQNYPLSSTDIKMNLEIIHL